MREKELKLIRTHTTVVKHYRDLQSIADYPVKVRKTDPPPAADPH
ncbi:CDP-diacylglycerol--serine O-phosphatidyltransferase [Klebsiella pneumoniae]|uniref:CDP-diacylglycerol--serine O-phosphatidyltransferase n=1 Tax=Klebsiella pneumoniae TaxID=573 RepID=A0A378BWG8_KLEPN|nr:CDP-diacylglycerol--serine O-phosphatidyltransferase [Klebsiella pneumoniae]